MRHLKHEILKELHDFDKKAEAGKLSYHDLEFVHLLSESYLKLYHVCELEKAGHEHTAMEPAPEMGNPHPHNPKEY